MYRYKIEQIALADGTTFSPGALTVIVGPNNSGKSRLWHDINDWCTQSSPSQEIVSDLKFNIPTSQEEYEEFYRDHLVEDLQRNLSIRPIRSDFNGRHSYGISNRVQLQQIVGNMLGGWNRNTQANFSAMFGHIFLSYLTTENRLIMAKESQSSGSELDISNILEALWKGDPEVSIKLDQIVSEVFGMNIRLDVLTNPGRYLFRVGPGVHEAATDEHHRRQILAKCARLDTQGDGARSFVATVLALLVARRSVLLIDEPEAFLHPPQATRLGARIAAEAQDSRQVIVATHSTDILRGIISTLPDTQIIRLTRNQSVARSQLLSGTNVRAIATSPMLSSTRILDGLFYRGVVVGEADADRSFYERVAAKILPDHEMFYTHAQNKQTLHSATRPLREMGVRCALVADFDLIRSRIEFKAVLGALTAEDLGAVLALRDAVAEAIGVTSATDRLALVRQAAEDALAAIPATMDDNAADGALDELVHRLEDATDEGDSWKAAKRNGKDALPEPAKRSFDELTAWCRAHGLFMVPVGELESWMVPHGLPAPSAKRKGRWIVKALERLSEISNLPTDSGVGRFILDIHDYLSAQPSAPSPS